VAAGISKAFERSKTFSLKIRNVIAEGVSAPYIGVRSFQLTIMSCRHRLCLKLFDDRFQPLQSPDEDEDGLEPRWFDRVVVAELYALNEAAAYDKLRSVQGSLVPWFYGTHQVMSVHQRLDNPVDFLLAVYIT
jgi:hypothetical protein